VVQTRLYPESTTSIVPIIARALRFASVRRGAALDPVRETPETLVADLRHLARTRPVLLAIDDIHLLKGDALAELAGLIEALAGETIAVLGLAPPVDLPARATLADVLAVEIRLPDLTGHDLATLWKQLFDIEPDPKIIGALAGATHGNPLAVRTALRGALRSGAFIHDPVAGNWRSAIPIPALAQTLKRNVELLSEGMVAHLTEAERRAAGDLAALGEIFALEAAQTLLEGQEGMIATLIAKGILVPTSGREMPIHGASSSKPVIAFTHTILHTYLAAQSRVDAARLITMIAAGLPLYSILPFQILARGAEGAVPSCGEASQAIRRALDAAAALDATADWRLGVEVWKGAVGMKSICSGIWEADEDEGLEAEIAATRALLLRRATNADDLAKADDGRVDGKADGRGDGKGDASTGNRLRLTVLDTIELHSADGGPVPIRGTRLRTLVGLLVADRMLDEPLDYREFSTIVAGTVDPDKARKTLNGVVFRLREILGHDAINTQEETPRLNLELVTADLLDAAGALGEAADALREGSLPRAGRRLLQVLAITSGKVPFPTLYENFFEATRERFETRLRTLLLKTAKDLLADGDARSAEELLRGGFAAMTGDEELAELLCDALVMLGKRAEAERVRMRMGG
jgi:hypothetical protein